MTLASFDFGSKWLFISCVLLLTACGMAVIGAVTLAKVIGVHRDVVGASGILDLAVNGRFTEGRNLPGKVDIFTVGSICPGGRV